MKKEDLKLAFNVTLHCVIGCGIGDSLGLILGMILKLAIVPTILLAVVLGFIGGYGLTMWPLLKKGFSFKEATKITVAGETASIFVMETGENLTALLIPGLLTASFFSSLFWIGFGFSILMGFIVAYPVNLFMIMRGLKRDRLHHH